jgi:hypothetical protein
MVKPATNNPSIDGLHRQAVRLTQTGRVLPDGFGTPADPP